MGMRASGDKERTNYVVQICLTAEEKMALSDYAQANHNGKVSIAGRALLTKVLLPEVTVA